MHWLYINATADIVFMCLAVFAMVVGVCACRSLWRLEKHLSRLKDTMDSVLRERDGEKVESR